MFDNKSQQPNTPPAGKSTPAAGSPAPPADQPKKLEDIFDKVDASEESRTAQPASPSAPANEPVIKTPPSVFTPLNNKEPASQDKPVADGSSIPSIPSPAKPKPRLTKKSIIILVIIIVCLGLGAAAYWWFGLRQANVDQPPAPADVLDLFDQDQPVDIEEDTPSAGPVPDDTPLRADDSDGDGLLDDQEILLGTSINSADTDNDGLFDKEEIDIYKTDPLRADTDNDGWQDGEEVKKHQDPLVPDSGSPPDNTYLDNQFKIRFTHLDNMVLESSADNTLQFNDNINQVKLYIYLQANQLDPLTPDVSYQISEDANGQLIIQASQEHQDQTPYSTDYNTNDYLASNGLTYLIRYIATQQAPDHQQIFERMLSSFQFLK